MASRKTKTYEEIQRKIDDGTAVVMTANELCDLVRKGEGDSITVDDVDIVTTGTKGLMSGSTAILHFRVSEAKKFKRAKQVFLNNIPCTVGPCPNETLGLIDTIVFATTHSIDRPKIYGGGHLFRDLVERKDIEVRVVTNEGAEFTTTTNLDDMDLAQYFSTRTMFRNYLAFVNPTDHPISSIFSSAPIQPNLEHMTFCGCGEINPFQKDPKMRTIGVGTRILLNGSPGMVVSRGTRSSRERPNIMAVADLKRMIPDYLGGFHTPEGPEVIVTAAVPIPILDGEILEEVKKIDSEIPLTVVDVNGRVAIQDITYGDVWHENFKVNLNVKMCAECSCTGSGNCPVELHCPTKCFHFNGNGKPTWDTSKCMNCGTCVNFCINGAFTCDLGEVTIQGKRVPVFCRQSDRSCAHHIMADLKRMIVKGEFKIGPPLAPLFDED
ncbi:MAG: methanogenesis marker 16 metalloprotein [Promethearchaeota archaeon]